MFRHTKQSGDTSLSQATVEKQSDLMVLVFNSQHKWRDLLFNRLAVNERQDKTRLILPAWVIAQ